MKTKTTFINTMSRGGNTLAMIAIFICFHCGVARSQSLSIDEMKRRITPAHEILEEYEKLKYETSPAGMAERERSNQYNQLIHEKNRASTENEYRELAERFRAMNGYKDTAQLASEYERLYNTLKTHRERLQFQYDWLVQEKNRLDQEKNRADRGKQYKELAQNFYAMSGYKDTAQLASECYKRYEGIIAIAREIEGAWRQSGNGNTLGDFVVKFNQTTEQLEMTLVKNWGGGTLGPGGITNVLYDGDMWSFDADLGGYKTAKFVLRKEDAQTFGGLVDGKYNNRWLKIQ